MANDPSSETPDPSESPLGDRPSGEVHGRGLEPGDTVSHFRIEGPLGGGGMGVVYRAVDTRLGRPVALKFLPSELSRDPEARRRFEIEARSASALEHANICTIYEVGETPDGRLYIAMAFYEGQTLKTRLEEVPLDIGEALDVARQVAAGLARAHERGIVHRDIKPANLIVTRHGEVRILDFGIAKLSGEVGLTRTGVSLGTLAYMAPEQVESDTVGPGADLWALGAVLFEMLTGRPPFKRDTAVATQAAVLTGNRRSVRELCPSAPAAVEQLVDDLLTVEAADRPQSAAEVARRLAGLSPGLGTSPGFDPAVPGPGTGARRLVLAVTVVVAVVGALGVWRWSLQRAEEQWARTEAIPEVLRLVGDNQMADAADLALRAEAVLGADPLLDPLWPSMTTRLRATTGPAGATLSFRRYDDPEGPWELLGETPFESDRFPMGAYRFRVKAEGYETVEVARSFISTHQLGEILNAGYDYLGDPSYTLDLRLRPVGAPDQDMVAVPGGPYGTVPVAGFPPLSPILIPGFLVDRTEVTNEAFAEFVLAGGYSDPSYWTEPLERGGRIVPLEEALVGFTDATGRQGPAVWSLGQPPAGEEELPVRGLSWFEASAYCVWKGKRLPTLYHWARATFPSTDSWRPFTPFLIEAANFDREGPVTVASRGAIGVSGAHDLVGNVREWSTTVQGDDRLILGGAWSDPAYRSHDVSGADPWDRGETNGFRCVGYPEGLPDDLAASFRLPEQNFSEVSPVPDAVFEANRAAMAYDRTLPLNPTLDSSRVLESGFRREWISIDTPYGDRMPIRLHIPPGAEPPHQAVVYFPGGNVLRSTRMDDLDVVPLDFLVRAGRVLVEPAYDGSFQRNDDRTVQRWSSPESRRELIRHWVQDLGRTLDYLRTRPDIEGSSVAYLGMSFGATMAPDFLAYEPRFAGAIFYSGGFSLSEPQASIDARADLASRVTMPILQLGSENDFYSPAENQEAMLRFFGAPDDRKRMQIYDSGHWPLPMNEVVRETVDFLDRVQGAEGG